MSPPEHPGEPPLDPARPDVAPRPRPTRGQWVTFGLLLGVSLLLLGLLVGSIWEPLFMATVLASALHGWHESLARRLHGRRGLSALLFTLGVVLLILAPLATVGVVLVRQAIDAAQLVQDALSKGGVPELIQGLPEPFHGWAESAVRSIGEGQASLVERAAQGGLAAAGALGQVLSRGTSIVVSTTLMLIGLDFLLADGARLFRWLADAAPLQGRQIRELVGELRTVIRSVVTSTIVTALVQGVVAGIGYAIAGVPQVIFFGLLTVFAAFIPSIGTALVAFPLVGLLVIQGHPWRALFLAGWAIVAVGLVDNLVRPLLIKGGAALHGAVVFFALVGGLAMFGPTGLVAGPLTVALFVAVVRLGRRDFAAS